MRDRRRSANSNWHGGRTITPAGYVLLRLPDHPRADVRGYVYEHVVVYTACAVLDIEVPRAADDALFVRPSVSAEIANLA